MSTPSRAYGAYDSEPELSQAEPLPYHPSHPNFRPFVRAFDSIQALIDSDTAPRHFEGCFVETLAARDGVVGLTTTRLDMSTARRDCHLTPRIIQALVAAGPELEYLDVTGQPSTLDLRPLESLLMKARHVNLGRNAIGLRPGTLTEMGESGGNLEYYAREAWEQDRSNEYVALGSGRNGTRHEKLRTLHILGGTVDPNVLANFFLEPPTGLRVARLHCPPSETRAAGGSSVRFVDSVRRIFGGIEGGGGGGRGARDLQKLCLWRVQGDPDPPSWREFEAVRSDVEGREGGVILAEEVYSRVFARGTRRLIRYDNGQMHRRREMKMEDQHRMWIETHSYIHQNGSRRTRETDAARPVLAFFDPIGPDLRAQIPTHFRGLRTLVLRHQTAALDVAALLSLPQLRFLDLSGCETAVTLGRLDATALSQVSRELRMVLLNDCNFVTPTVLEAVALSPNLAILSAERLPLPPKKKVTQAQLASSSLDPLLRLLSQSRSLVELYLRNQGVVQSPEVLETFLSSCPQLKILHLDHPLTDAQLRLFKRAHPGLLRYVCISPKVNQTDDEDEGEATVDPRMTARRFEG